MRLRPAGLAYRRQPCQHHRCPSRFSGCTGHTSLLGAACGACVAPTSPAGIPHHAPSVMEPMWGSLSDGCGVTWAWILTLIIWWPWACSVTSPMEQMTHSYTALSTMPGSFSENKTKNKKLAMIAKGDQLHSWELLYPVDGSRQCYFSLMTKSLYGSAFHLGCAMEPTTGRLTTSDAWGPLPEIWLS